MLTLTLKRKNTFSFHTTGAKHCGTKDQMTARYIFTCRCSSESLDSNGFLFDQLIVDKFFQAIKTTAMSCEQLSIWCARELFKIVKASNKKCDIQYMSLELAPEPFQASMTFEYHKEHGK